VALAFGINIPLGVIIAIGVLWAVWRVARPERSRDRRDRRRLSVILSAPSSSA
jgi:hypothetical protein